MLTVPLGQSLIEELFLYHLFPVKLKCLKAHVAQILDVVRVQTRCSSSLQVYRSDTGQLMFMSKFQGRRLTLQDFKEALFQFFHTGRRLRRELLSPVLHKLRDMQAALEACESYRFYSSSLLIIYDGASPLKHAHQHHENGAHIDNGDDDNECEQAEAEPDMEEVEEAGQAEGAFSFPNGLCPSSDGGNSGDSQMHAASSDPMVDVRMIDFAHTTCRHFQGDSVVYEGLDSGCLFGLQNLITIISELENSSEP